MCLCQPLFLDYIGHILIILLVGRIVYLIIKGKGNKEENETISKNEE